MGAPIMKTLILKIAGLCQVIGLLCLVASNPCFAKTLTLATSDGPPYMIKETDSGLDIEIPREALKRAGVDLSVQYMALNRAQIQVQMKAADLMAPFFQQNTPGLYISEPYVMYRPAAFSLSKNELNINTLQDLGNYEIITFQGARGYFGPTFMAATRKSPSYIEHHDMTVLITLLSTGRTDVVVLDYNIFHYFLNQAHSKASSGNALYRHDVSQPITFHDIFPQVPAVAAFHDQTHRDLFNKGLKAIKADGTHAKIIGKYIKSNQHNPSTHSARPQKQKTLIPAIYALTSESWVPYWIVSKKQVSGILNDVMEELNLRVTNEFIPLDPVPPKRAQQHFNLGKTQLECCVNEEWRKRETNDIQSLWSKTVLETEEVLIFPKNKSFPFKQVSDLTGKKIATILGYGYVGEKFITRHDSLSNLSLLKLVATGRSDAGIIDRNELNFMTKTNTEFKKLMLKIEQGPVINRSELKLRIHKSRPELLLPINEALAEMHRDGTIQRIIERYSIE